MNRKRMIVVPSNASSIHRKVLGMVSDLFPQFRAENEGTMDVWIDGRRTTCRIDIAIPQLKLAIEVHGEQHYRWIPHFHKTQEDFDRQKRLDEAKKQMVTRAGWAYLAIPYDQVPSLRPKALLKQIKKAMETQQ